MNRRLVLCAFLAGFGCACSSSGTITSGDASAPDAYSPPSNDGGDIDTGTVLDAFVPPPSDSGAFDAADAADAADAPDEDASTCTWNGSYESPACTACLRTECCGTAQACETDPACVAVDQCVDSCIANGGADAGDGGDAGSISTCAQSCFDSQSATVKSEWQALSHCLEFQCGNSGAGPCE